MPYISADKFKSPILKKIAEGDESIFSDASNDDFSVKEVVDIFSYEWSPLFLACNNGHVDIVKRLLQIPEIANNAAANNNYALYWSARAGHLDIVKKLLQTPEVLENVSTNSNCALAVAAQEGRNEIAYTLSKIQWPRGVIDMPAYFHEFLPAIYYGSIIAFGKKEFEGMIKCWIKGKPTNNTSDIHYPGHDTSSKNLVRVDRYNAPRAIMQYAGCRM